MVLTRCRGGRGAARPIALAIAVAAAGCAPRVGLKPAVQAPEGTSVALAAVVDAAEGCCETAAFPAAAAARVAAPLSSRRLEVRTVTGDGSLLEAFATKRSSGARLAALAKQAGDAEWIALVEAKAEFYSVLNGRYRWIVTATGGIAPRDRVDQVRGFGIDIPVFLDFDHEKEEQAVEAAAARIATEIGRVADDLLAAGSSSTAAPRGDAIYFVMVDRFSNGDPTNDGETDLLDPQAFHGGDLQGVIDRLDHLERLGIGAVWLSPVFRMRTEKFGGHGAYHGYWVEEFESVEPRFGDETTLRRLSDALHARGMKLVLDVVLNHVAPGAPLTRSHSSWFHGKGSIVDWSDPVQLVERDVHGLPDLAQEREEVYRHLLGTSLRWIDAVRPDAFRLDAARHMPIEFWRRYNGDLKRLAPQVRLLGELYDGSAEALSRALSQGGFDAIFDFPLYFAMDEVFCRGADPARLGVVLTEDRRYEDPSVLVTFLDNHDVPRVRSSCASDDGSVDAALAFLLTARGTPSLTYGTESGLTGRTEPENRGDMRFEGEGPFAATIRRLLAARREHRSLRDGVTRLLLAEEGLFAYARIDDDEAALVAVNRRDAAAAVAVPDELRRGASVRDLRTGERRQVGPKGLVVAPRSTEVFLLKPRKGGYRTAAAAARERLLRPDLRAIEFRASGLALGPGETAWLVGSGEELGAWDVKRGVALRADRDETWSATVPLPVGGLFEMKLVVVGPNGTRWESGANRSLLVGEAAAIPLSWRGTTVGVGGFRDASDAWPRSRASSTFH